MHFARITSALAFLSFGISSLAAPVGHAPAELAARSPKPLPPVLSTALTTIAAAHVKLSELWSRVTLLTEHSVTICFLLNAEANAAAKAYGKVATQLGVIAGALLDADVDIKPDVGASLSALLGTWDYQKDVVNVWATILAVSTCLIVGCGIALTVAVALCPPPLQDVSLDIQTAEGLDGHTAIKTQLDAVLCVQRACSGMKCS